MPLPTHLSSLRVNRWIALGFALAISLISIGFALSFYSYSRSQQDSERMAHTFQVISALEEILSLVKDVETGTRGFMATNDAKFLEPYYDARPKIDPALLGLKQLLQNDPEQQRQADKLAGLTRAKVDISDRQTQFIRQSFDSLQRTYLLVGKVRMDQLRDHTSRMIQHEEQLLNKHRATAQRSFQTTLALIFALSLLTFAVLLISYNLLDKELRQRLDNEAKLRDYETKLQAQIQQLEVSNQELERFAFVASHDMQEPLRKIQTFGALLTDHQTACFNEEGQLYLEKILTSAHRMSALIRDLLGFSRLKNQPDDFQPVDLNQVLSRVLADLKLVISRSGGEVTSGTLPTLDAVPSQMEQLLTNLISNALKYTEPGVLARICIASEAISGDTIPGLVPERTYHQLTISDNGIGFDEKYLDRIFDVFQRLHAKTEYEGTGIGLAICKRVVTYHQGYITATSREGAGTTFIVVLPERQTVVATPAEHSEATA